MPEVVSYKKDERLIHVKSVGHLSVDVVRNSILRVGELSKEHKISNVFVDQLEALSFPSGANALNLGSDVAHLLKGLNIAMIYSPEVKEDLSFFAKAARVRGGNMEVFENEESAKKWFDEQQG